MNSRLSTPAPADVAQQVRLLISRRKRVRMSRLRVVTQLTSELHFDLVDVVDIILEVERYFHLTIPDEVPLHTVGDLVTYVRAHRLAPATA